MLSVNGWIIGLNQCSLLMELRVLALKTTWHAACSLWQLLLDSGYATMSSIMAMKMGVGQCGVSASRTPKRVLIFFHFFKQLPVFHHINHQALCCEHREHGSGWNWLMTLAEKTRFLISIVIMLYFFDELLTFLLEDVLSSLKEAAAGSSYPTKSSNIVFLNISRLSLGCYQSCQQDALWGEMEPTQRQPASSPAHARCHQKDRFTNIQHEMKQ